MLDLDTRLAGPLQTWVAMVRTRARLVAALCVLATLGAAFYAGIHLGINSDTIQLFPEDLPARRNHDAFIAQFPDLENALLIVVDGQTPETTRAAADALIDSLRGAPAHFEDAYYPTGGPFFERHALLYQDVDDLEEFSDRMIDVQPIIAELERDPSIENLASLIATGLEHVSAGGVGTSQLIGEILDRIGDASAEVYREHPLAISWEDLIVSGSAIDTATRRVVLAHPVLDFTQALPAAGPLQRVREASETIRKQSGDAIRIRVTGNPALTHEETLSIVWDIGVSGVFCLLLVTAILLFALRSGPLVAGVVTTLLVGLVWTAAFAALAVGDLNVISVAAAVLFLGLGVDFGLHLAMRYADLARCGNSHEHALDEATRGVGGSLVICTITTAIGFFAFLPTDYKGVAELGLITGVGLIIILFLTLTLLPALITTVFRPDPEQLKNKELRFGDGPSRFIARNAPAIRGTALAVGLLSLFLLPSLRFDANIVAMRDPSTESVKTFNDLLADAGTASPWYANSVASSLELADAIKVQMNALPGVERSITLSDYVPAEQDEKLEILEDLSFMLGPGRAQDPAPTQGLDSGEQIAALRRLHSLVAEASMQAKGEEAASPLLASMEALASRLDVFLMRVDREDTPDAALRTLEGVLLSTLPDQIARLRAGVDAQRVTRDALPTRVVERLLTSQGRARVQTFPKENLEDHEAFVRFVEEVQSVDPNATGIAVNLVEFARTTQEAFRQALTTALVVIAAILWFLWRSPRDMLLVLAPLGLAGVATGAIMVVLDQPLNFFNVVVVPLLMGAGVDSAIHLVEQSRRRKPGEVEILGTTTARAVLFSALTTITSFGSLALSSHLGLAGLGTLLSVGMTLTVVCNLVVLPAMLAKFSRPGAGIT